MKITIEIHRRHLYLLPITAGVLAAFLTIGAVGGLTAVLITAAAYFGTGLLLAIIDTVLCKLIRWRRRRRDDRAIEKSIAVHPANHPDRPSPKHKRTKGAVAA